MKKVKAKVCVPMIMILIGIACIANGSWSWVGATAWCSSFDDGWCIAHGSVAWSGMAGGSWSTTAQIGNEKQKRTGAVQNCGGGFSHLERQTEPNEFVESIANIGGMDNIGVPHSSNEMDTLDCKLCNDSGCSECS